MKVDKVDRQLEVYLINRYFSMPKLFDSLGIDYRVNANMFCPWHYNETTPAAHLYADENGYRVWCFADSKMYGAWNIYKSFIPSVNTNKLATEVFNSLSEQDQERIIHDLGTEQELDVLPYQDKLNEFKQHKINIKELLHYIADSYQDEA